MGLNMKIKVRIYIDNIVVDSSDLEKIAIKNSKVDRIINDIVEHNLTDKNEVTLTDKKIS